MNFDDKYILLIQMHVDSVPSDKTIQWLHVMFTILSTNLCQASQDHSFTFTRDRNVDIVK